MKAYMNWSGGKDSSLCLYEIFREKKYDVKYLLTSVNQAAQRISMHGVRTALLYAQAEAIGIPLRLLELPEELIPTAGWPPGFWPAKGEAIATPFRLLELPEEISMSEYDKKMSAVIA